jgi:uncharacterized RDD family membrane protein YckC
MARSATIITPENIPLDLELAGLGTRVIALFIDIFCFGILLFVYLIAVGAMGVVVGSEIGNVLIYLGTFLLIFGYFIFLEMLWNGQSLGKRAMSIRVIRDGGYPITLYASVIRNLIRVADFLPIGIPFLPGALSVFCHPQYKRLGDMLAGTLVVKEPQLSHLYTQRQYVQSQERFATGTLGPLANNPFDVLTPTELSLFRRFAQRRWEMNPNDAERLAYRLVAPRVVRLQLQFQPGVPPRYADLLCTIVALADKTARERGLDF